MRRQDDQTMSHRVIVPTMATNYPAKNVRADLYAVLVEVAKASTCPVLKMLAEGKVYYRGAKRLVEGLEIYDELSPIEKVDMEMRDNIMRMVQEQLHAKPSPLRLKLYEYSDLKWLTEMYWELCEVDRMNEGYWCKIRNRVNKISPRFYLTVYNTEI